MTESKEKLDHLRAKRGGHRGVCTKLAKETEELLHLPGDIDVDRSLLSGRVPTYVESEDPTVSNLILTGEPFETSSYSNTRKNDDKIAASLKRFWETESIGITDYQQESSGNSNFIHDIRFTGERYEVRLPWKEECLEIEDDYRLCHNQLLALRQRLMKRPELLREYDEGIQ